MISRIATALSDLESWLGLGEVEIVRLTGAKLGTSYEVFSLLRLHELIGALRESERARPPLRARSPLDVLLTTTDRQGVSAYALLRSGQYDAAEALLRPLIFEQGDRIVRRDRVVTSLLEEM